MNITEDLKSRLKTITTSNITDDTFKKLAENTFAALTRAPEVHNISTLYNSKPDVIKAGYAALLTIGAELGRHNFDKDGVKSFLVAECGYSANRAGLFSDLFEKNKQDLHIALGNIGSHLPHVTDVKWKIDYIIKTSSLNQADGPIFRVCLVADEYESVNGCKKSKHIMFSCNSQELQDLVYKLKDAVRHCQRVVAEH